MKLREESKANGQVSPARIAGALLRHPDHDKIVDMWQEKNNSLYKKFEFDSFEQATEFTNQVFDIARQLDHHPKLINEFNIVSINLSTHNAGSKVTERDKDLARRIDNLFSKKPENSTQLSLAKLFTDGGSRGNPGPSAIGYVICNLDDDVVKKYGKYIGESTNNKAEYKALIAGLQSCLSIGAKSLQVFMDSELIINQMIGKYRVKNQDLKPLHARAKELAGKFRIVEFSHVPREQNSIADGLVNEALDQAR